MKRGEVACAFVFVRNFLEYVSATNMQNRIKSDKNITTIKGWFLRHCVVLTNET